MIWIRLAENSSQVNPLFTHNIVTPLAKVSRSQCEALTILSMNYKFVAIAQQKNMAAMPRQCTTQLGRRTSPIDFLPRFVQKLVETLTPWHLKIGELDLYSPTCNVPRWDKSPALIHRFSTSCHHPCETRWLDWPRRLFRFHPLCA